MIRLYILVSEDYRGRVELLKAYTHRDIAQGIADSLNKSVEDTSYSPQYLVQSVVLADS